MFAASNESGFPNEVIKNVLLNPDLPIETTMDSAAGLPSTGVKNQLIERIKSDAKNYYRERIRKCTGCLGPHCKFKNPKVEKRTPYCIGYELNKVQNAKTEEEAKGSLVFAGKVLERIRGNDELFRPNGKIVIPSTSKVFSYLVGEGIKS